jgi:hypothetical protein
VKPVAWWNAGTGRAIVVKRKGLPGLVFEEEARLVLDATEKALEQERRLNHILRCRIEELEGRLAIYFVVP